jgi:V/A-type H+-transporting ATPase subunit I
MSIVRLTKLSLVGLLQDKEAVLDELQALGCMHLLPLADRDGDAEQMPPEKADNARKALRYLMDVPVKRHQIRYESRFNMDTAVFTVLTNRHRLRDVMDRRDALRLRIRELAPWGDFELPPLEDLGGQRLWFYVVPHNRLTHLQQLQLPWQVVHHDYNNDWVVVISPTEPPQEHIPAKRVRTGSNSLARLRRHLEETELELEDIHAERESLTRWISLMSHHLVTAENRAALKHAEAHTLDRDGMFAIQGWAPEARVGELQALADARGLALLLESPTDEDMPPTLLSNPERLAAGENLVGFYQVPAYRAWDPSRLLFFSFALFFAMIMSDAGYAAVLAVVLGLFWRRLGASVNGRRMRVLSSVLVGSSALWGVLVGSYFGFGPPPDSWLAPLAVLDLRDFDSMMRISVGIGVLHLVLANAQKAVVNWGLSDAGVSVGWILVLLGGYLLWLAGDDPGIAYKTGQGGIVVGLILVMIAAGEFRAGGAKDTLWSVVKGLQALTSITKIFGDVLSYLRLFALGLASASLALTFNDLARQVYQQVEGLGLLLAILIMLIGHVLNLALGLMSGVVHGLRLNYIEFYNWALSGEGYPFRPFTKKESP